MSARHLFAQTLCAECTHGKLILETLGYASNETENYMPLALDLSHRILQVLADIRREATEIPYLRPDAKSQVTIQYSDDNKPERIEAIVVSTQHDDFDSDDEVMLARIKKDIVGIVIPRVKAALPAETQALFGDDIKYHINPTGKFVIGGPHGDTGLTGRKIIVDTYGGKGAHGGGAFSGKDPSKVDRSAAYATRHVAKNLVAAGVCDQVLAGFLCHRCCRTNGGFRRYLWNSKSGLLRWRNSH